MSSSEGGMIYFTYEDDDDPSGNILPEGSTDNVESLDESKIKSDQTDNNDGNAAETVTDHDYIELIDGKDIHELSNIEEGTIIIIQDDDDEENIAGDNCDGDGDGEGGVDISLSKSVDSPLSKEESFSQITNLSQLKKITPRVKLPSSEKNLVRGLAELRKMNPQSRDRGKRSSIDDAKQQLKKYCRTCAGLKLPLVDIFSEKGRQMRLNQQMKHLKEIDQLESLSTQMCMDCICDLKMSYKFFMQIKKAEFKLKSIYTALSEVSETNDSKKDSQSDETIQNVAWNNPKVKIEKDVHTYAKKKSNPLSTTSGQKSDQTTKGSSFFASTQDDPNASKSTPIKLKEEPVSVSDGECVTDMFEDVTDPNLNEDNESIEEFDPEDPPINADSSDYGESNDELEELGLQQAKKARIMEENEQIEFSTSPAVYQYDLSKKAYVNYETGESNENSPLELRDVIKTEAVENETGENKKQPNILKRRLSMPVKSKPILDSLESSQSADSNNSNSNTEKTLLKLSMDNPISIGTKGEDGIMYVTVKGSKPNEMLLVKVKKMDKPPGEKNEETNIAHAAIDMKPVDRMLKKYEALKMKEKDLFSDKYRKPDIREQIIEEQIEEYKRRREQVLGGNMIGLSSTINSDDGASKVTKTEGSTSYQRRYSQQSSVENDTSKTKEEVADIPEECEEEIQLDEEYKEEIDTSVEHETTKDKTYARSEEYLARLARLKQKWEEAKQKRESLQKELDESCAEGNQEKLERILGEKDKNLEEFQDYLKQRKIVINRLKDEDIISLYEDRNNAVLKESLS